MKYKLIKSKNKIHIFLIVFSMLLYDISLISPIRFAYMQSYGIDISSIGYLKFAYLTTIFLFEIPSGFIADRFGKKKSIIFSCMFMFLYFISLITFTNIFGFVLSQFFLGVSTAFLSGADSSFIKDLIIEEELSGNISYLEVKTFLSIGSKIISMLSALFASSLFSYNKILPFLISSFSCLISILLLLFLPEKKHIANSDKLYSKLIKEFLNSAFQSIKIVFKDSNFKYLIILDSLILSGIVYVFDTYQFKFKSIGIDINYFGYIYAICAIFSLFGRFLTLKIKKYIGGSFHPKFIFITFLSLSFSMVLYTLSKSILLLLPVLFIQQVIYSVWNLAVDNRTIHAAILYEDQATFLSVYSQAISIFRIIFSLLFSILLKFISINVLIITISILLIFVSFNIVNQIRSSDSGEL